MKTFAGGLEIVQHRTHFCERLRTAQYASQHDRPNEVQSTDERADDPPREWRAEPRGERAHHERERRGRGARVEDQRGVGVCGQGEGAALEGCGEECEGKGAAYVGGEWVRKRKLGKREEVLPSEKACKRIRGGGAGEPSRPV